MLYIHELEHLNPKVAETEIVQPMRALRRDAKFPVALDDMQRYFSSYFISEQALLRVESCRVALEQVSALCAQLQLSSRIDQTNLQRSISIISGFHTQLQGQKVYLEHIYTWQKDGMRLFCDVINALGGRSSSSMQELNTHISAMFYMLLQTQDFRYDATTVINLAQKSSSKNLYEALEKGFLLPKKIADELQGKKTTDLLASLSEQERQTLLDLVSHMEVIAQDMHYFYAINMKNIEWSIHLYAWIKWVQQREKPLF